MKADPFVIAMALAIALAAAAPQIGAAHGLLHIGLVTQIGITAVFFLHGAAISRASLRAGAGNWRLHLLVQGTTFVLFPLLGTLCYLVARDLGAQQWGLGLFYLCAVSSTISSSVALTAMARGDVAAAVFNATVSALLGMMLTPLLIGLLDASDSTVPVSSALADIVLKLFLPFAMGQAVQPWVAVLIEKRKPLLNVLDRTVIVLIVYGAFCESIAAGAWSRHSAAAFVTILVSVAGLLALALLCIHLSARSLKFTREQKIAALFCGSQKSLANGAPMAKILFGSHPALAMIMLPLLMYHQLQIIACSMLARRYAAGEWRG